METNANADPSFQIDFAKVPFGALRHRSRSILSRSLNSFKVLPSAAGLPRDWRGIAHLAGLQSIYDPVINAETDQISKVLSLWCTDGDTQTASFDNLVKYLGVIERWDVADDLSESLVEDAQAYKSKLFQKQLIVARQEAADALKETEGADVSEACHPDANILTKDDVIRAQQGLPPQQYDAFVLFADEDIEFATELIERMEENHPRFGFKLCLKDRDLIGGISFEHEAILRLIAERCNRLVVVISAAFLKYSENLYFVNFVQALQLKQHRRCFVPCLYENCVLPPNLIVHFHLKYYQLSKLCKFWDRLGDSIRGTNTLFNGNAVRDRASPSRMTEIPDSPTQPAIAGSPTNTAPIKLPRKKGMKLPAVDTSKVHSKTEPKTRSAFTMFELNASRYSLSKNNLDMNQSETNLPRISSTKSIRSNNSKWYTKLLLPNRANTSVTSLRSFESITKRKNKTSWLKKRW